MCVAMSMMPRMSPPLTFASLSLSISLSISPYPPPSLSPFLAISCQTGVYAAPTPTAGGMGVAQQELMRQQQAKLAQMQQQQMQALKTAAAIAASQVISEHRGYLVCSIWLF